jgi:predicted metal-dependent enzyme (double-stranded beta helix superfamily)
MTLAATSLWIVHPHGAQVVAIDRGSRDYTLPEQMQWKDTENGRIANLYGDPSKAGLYAYVVKRGPNTWSMPHFHDNDRFVTVLEGTFWVGTGKFDPQRTVPLKAGSFVRDVAGGVHFEGTKDDGATLYFVGIGPSPDHPAEPGTNVSGVGANVLDPAIRQIQRIEDMPKESFVLYGDSSKPGLYLQYQRRAPNNWSTPHYHPIDRVVMVMGGTMRIGTGPTGDKISTRCQRADSSTISLAVSTTTGPGTIRCGFSRQVSGRQRRSMSTRRNSSRRVFPIFDIAPLVD